MPGSTILVIEDNSIQREGLAAVLRQHGYTVLTAEGGREALRLLSSGSIPDLILLDMLIPPPADDGWWLLQKRQRSAALASIPVIITTALSIAGQEWAASLGAAGLVRKPFDVPPLMAEIRRCLADKRQG